MIQNKYLRQPEWLYRQYYKQGLSTLEIAAVCGCGRDTVCRRMESFGIKRRTFEEARSFRFLDRKYRNRNWLYRKYWVWGYGLKRLAGLCNVSKSTIRHWLRKHNLGTRTPMQAYSLQWGTSTLNEFYGSFYNRILLMIKDIAESFRRYFKGGLR